MMMEEECVSECDCAHEQAGRRRLDSLRPTGARTRVVRVRALSLVAVRNNPFPSYHRDNQKIGKGSPGELGNAAGGRAAGEEKAKGPEARKDLGGAVCSGGGSDCSGSSRVGVGG